MPPRSISPASTADQKAEHQRKKPDHAATPPPPPPQKDIYATLASTLAPMDAEQYYQSIQRNLSADHATLQGWKQEKRNDIEWGTEEDLLWEDTWKGTMDAFLEAAAETYPHPPGDTRHGLHASLASHSWKHRHTITLHPLDHNPHRWTPEDDATAAITIQQNPENREESHITWNDPAPHPPCLPQPPRRQPPSAQNCRKRNPHNKQTKRSPRHHLHQRHRKAPAQSPSPTRSPQWSSPHSTAPPRTATAFGTCHGNGRSTRTHSDGTKSHSGSRPSASTRSPNPPPPGHYQRTATTSSSPSKGMPPSHQRRETP